LHLSIASRNYLSQFLISEEYFAKNNYLKASQDVSET
jgi:hypothetical protein